MLTDRRTDGQTDGRTDGHHQSISRNCFAIRPKTTGTCLVALIAISDPYLALYLSFKVFSFIKYTPLEIELNLFIDQDVLSQSTHLNFNLYVHNVQVRCGFPTIRLRQEWSRELRVALPYSESPESNFNAPWSNNNWGILILSCL